MNLTGTSLASLATATTTARPHRPGLRPDQPAGVLTVSSPVQSANTIQRVNYNGTGLPTRFTASGSVQRCTALDLDPADGLIFFPMPGQCALAHPLGPGAPAPILSLTATAKKVRWFNAGSTTAPPRP